MRDVAAETRPFVLALALLVAGVAGCASSSSGEEGSDADAEASADMSSETGAAGDVREETDTADTEEGDTSGEGDERQSVVTFETSDGVTLEADYLRPTGEGRGAVALFHMIPPNHDRTNFPQRVLEELASSGIAVLNVDRRGAGDSEGDPKNAYEGPKGRLDVEAAVRFLLSDERRFPSASDKIVLVGASNGTTSTWDYAVNRKDADLPDPSALVWMSPGDYTVEQNSIEDNRSTAESTPIFWIHPGNEPWSESFESGKPDNWTFLTLENGEHGTLNFDDGSLESTVLPPLVDWVHRHTE